MKIFYIITKSEAGGAQTHVWQLARHMRALGHEVALMCPPNGWLVQALHDSGVKFYPNLYLANTFNPIADFRAAKALEKALADFQPDLVSCHSTKAGLIARLTIRNRIPTIFTAHGWGFTEGVGLLQKILITMAEKFASRYCKKIICVSDYDRQLALQYRIAPPEKLIVVHNGVETGEFHREHSGSISRSDNRIHIVFVGRLSRPKDPALLLKALSDLAAPLRDRVTLEIIGGGQRRKAIERLILKLGLQDRVVLRGELPRGSVLLSLAQADIFVLTTNYEGFPRSILEAMSVGLPIIASDVGGVREAVTPECGIVVPRGDRAAVARALESLLRDPERIKEMGQQARERAEGLFSLERMLEATKKIYDDVYVSRGI